MLFSSDAQRKFMFARLPQVANKWQEESKSTKLPKKKKGKTTYADIYSAKKNRGRT
jgi:hypothetical protein